MEKDRIKILEDCIQIQNKDFSDTCKDIDNNINKNSIILALNGLLIINALDNFINSYLVYKIIFIIFILISSFFALINMLGSEIESHTNVDNVFLNEKYEDYNEYLKDKHQRLSNNYTNLQKLLFKKSIYTKISVIFLILSILIFTIKYFIL